MATSSYNTQHHPLPSVPQHEQAQSYGYQNGPAQQYQQQQQPYAPQGQPAQQYQQQPPQPQPQLQQSTRPVTAAKTRGLSFRSEKSHRSSNSAGKNHYQETHAEKESKRLHSKADPTLAMNEMEPAAIAAQAADKDAALRPLSSIQHKGYDGLAIADPDRSNPTRSRWERPLETIRSFEAAIDGNYNRKSFYRSESETALNGWNRRTSQYGNQNGPRFPQNSYYGSRPQSIYRSESVVYDTGRQEGGPSGYLDGPHDNGRQRYNRAPSEPYLNRANGARNVYPMSNSHQSHETVASGSGSWSEPAGYSTDPSSENSSMGRRSPPKRQDHGQDFGNRAGPSNYDNRSFAPSGLSNSQSNHPAVPRKDIGGGMLRKQTAPPPVSAPQARPAAVEKRKSWFSKRFSKA